MNETRLAEEVSAGPKKIGAMRRMKKPVAVAGVAGIAIAAWMLINNWLPGGGSPGGGDSKHEITITPKEKEKQDQTQASKSKEQENKSPAAAESREEFLTFSTREVLTIVVRDDSYAVRQEINGKKVDHVVDLDDVVNLARKTTGNDQNIHIWIAQHYTANSKVMADLRDRLQAKAADNGAGLSPTEIYTLQDIETN